MKQNIIALCILSITSPLSIVMAEDDANQTKNLGPDVQILQRNNANIQEFKTNGKVYMIKVIPKKGPAYYLVDADGDGDFDTRRNDLQPKLLIPSWVLFSW